MSLVEQSLLLSESVEDHEVEEDTEEGERHVRGDHDHPLQHAINMKPVRCNTQAGLIQKTKISNIKNICRQVIF